MSQVQWRKYKVAQFGVGVKRKMQLGGVLFLVGGVLIVLWERVFAAAGLWIRRQLGVRVGETPNRGLGESWKPALEAGLGVIRRGLHSNWKVETLETRSGSGSPRL